MSETTELISKWHLKPWLSILIFGILQSCIYALGTYFFDFFAGSATLGFGIMNEKVWGIGMFFIYMIGYFNAIAVILPVLLIRRFGVATAVYLPYAIVGFFVEYYYEFLKSHALLGIWAVFGWSLVGLATGFSVDLAFKFLPSQLNYRWRSILTGMVLGIASFLFNLAPLYLFYNTPAQSGPGSYLGVAYFALPWLIINSSLGGYTAYAIFKRV